MLIVLQECYWGGEGGSATVSVGANVGDCDYYKDKSAHGANHWTEGKFCTYINGIEVVEGSM